MATLTFGVVDVAYVGADEKATTTGDVAEYLEEDFHVMAVFFEAKKNKILELVNDQLGFQIEAMMQGAFRPHGDRIFLPEVESLFRDFVTTREIETITGQTEAARLGVSHRFKDANNRTVSPQAIVSGKSKASRTEAVAARAPRASFVDTGLYVASFKSWLNP